MLLASLFASVSRGASMTSFDGSEARHGMPGNAPGGIPFRGPTCHPGTPRPLSSAFLFENLDLAFAARTNFPWAASVPEELFPERRPALRRLRRTAGPWRAELGSIARELVGNARTASEAAQALNQGLFNPVQVHYSTGRKRPNQSLRESKELGKATCTGLSIIPGGGMPAVGIPRAVGTPLWTNERGKPHLGGDLGRRPAFRGADEYDAAGLDRGWFTGDAAQARADVPKYAIYATSWKRDGLSFPMVWSKDSNQRRGGQCDRPLCANRPGTRGISAIGASACGIERAVNASRPRCVLTASEELAPSTRPRPARRIETTCPAST